MKKILSIFICVLLLIMPLSVTAFAADELSISMPSNTISATKNNELLISFGKDIKYTADSIDISFVFDRKLKLLDGDFINADNAEKVILLDSRAASLTLDSATEIKGDLFKLNITCDEVASGLTFRVTVVLRSGEELVFKGNATATFKAVCSEHNFGEWKNTVQAQCEAKGSRTRNCSICKFTETEEIAPLGHDFSNIEILRDATCLEIGYRRAFCKNCQQKLLEEIDPKGHNMGEWKTTVKSTCVAKGTEESVCSGCGLTETRETEPIGHEFKEAVITTEPTIGKEGVETGYCIRCNESTDSPVPCAHSDKTTGIRMDTKKGVYPETAKAKISEIKNGSSLHSGVADALAHITNQFIAYSIDVTNLGFSLEPDGEVMLTFPIPEKFGNHSVFYYITEENSVKKLTVQKSEDGKFSSFKFMGNGRYAVCKTAYAVDDEFVAAASADGSKIIIISVLILVLCWTIIALKIIKAKNKKLYRKIMLFFPTKSELRNAIKRYIFIFKEKIKKPQ